MITDYFRLVAGVLPRIPAEPVERIVEIMIDAQLSKRTVFMIGNGGSSANDSREGSSPKKGTDAIVNERETPSLADANRIASACGADRVD